MNNFGDTIEKIFGVVLILVGSICIVSILAGIYDKSSEDSLIVDMLLMIPLGLLPIYFGFKLYNGFDILTMKSSEESYTLENMFNFKDKDKKKKNQDKKKLKKE